MVFHHQAGRNQTKVGLKDEAIIYQPLMLSEKKSDQGGIESCITQLHDILDGGRNQTKVGLKGKVRVKRCHIHHEKKSDQGGIERCHSSREVPSEGRKKSDQGGIESSFLFRGKLNGHL